MIGDALSQVNADALLCCVAIYNVVVEKADGNLNHRDSMNYQLARCEFPDYSSGL